MKKLIMVFGVVAFSTVLLTACGESKDEKITRLTNECTKEMSKDPMSMGQSKACKELEKISSKR